MPHSPSLVTPPWTAIVPARAGSKGLAHKNTRSLAGMPLYMHAVTQAIEAGASTIIISTNIQDILNTSHMPGVVVIHRPEHLCTDTTPMADVIEHALIACNTSGTVALLQATSPLRTSTHIKQALELQRTQQHHLIMSVCQADKSVLKWGLIQGEQFVPLNNPAYCFENRQSLPQVYKPNGAIYAFDAHWFLKNKGFITDSIGVITMSTEDSFDIDNLADFELCAQRLQSRLQDTP